MMTSASSALPSSRVLPSNVDTFAHSSAEQIRYAGFWRRFGAYLVDLITVTVVTSMISLLIVFLAVLLFGTQGARAVESIAAWLGFIGVVLYFPVMESSLNQATIGKQMLGIMVTTERGKRISFGQALGRYVAKWLSAMTLLIGYLMAGFTPRKQALHDMVAGTLVVVGKPA